MHWSDSCGYDWTTRDVAISCSYHLINCTYQTNVVWGSHAGRCVTKRLERWTCNLKALNSSAALRLQPGCVLCRLKIKSSAKLVNNQLVCLLPVGILTNFVYSVLLCWSQCKLLGTQQLCYQYKKRSLKSIVVTSFYSLNLKKYQVKVYCFVILSKNLNVETTSGPSCSKAD